MITIVNVTCAPTENSALREGIVQLFKLYFDELLHEGCHLGFQDFESEWTSLPGKYDFQSQGGLFAAVQQNHATDPEEFKVVGCVAIRPLSHECGEVKRMYVLKTHRRLGVGKLLTQRVINYARSTGYYKELKLDSLERLQGALKLYEQFGFQRIPAYCHCPEHDHVCMNLYFGDTIDECVDDVERRKTTTEG